MKIVHCAKCGRHYDASKAQEYSDLYPGLCDDCSIDEYEEDVYEADKQLAYDEDVASGEIFYE